MNEYSKKVVDIAESMDIYRKDLENQSEEFRSFQRCNDLIADHWEYKLGVLPNGFEVYHRDGSKVGFDTVFKLESYLKERFGV